VLKYKFKNIRNVNRYINTLNLTFEMVRDDVYNVDYYALKALQVFLPEFYHFIKKNKDLLLYDYQYSINSRSNDKEIIKKELAEAINNLNLSDIPIQNVESFLQVLFPNLKRIYTNVDNRDYMSEWRVNKRLCTGNNFDTYFKYAVPSWEISKEEFDQIVYSETNEMIKRILTLPPNLQIKFISHLDSIIRNEHYIFHENNKKSITGTMYCIGNKIGDETDVYPYIIIVERIIVNLLKTMDVEKAFVILKNAITKSNNLDTICELSCGILHDLEKDEPKEDIINLKKSHVDELKLIITKKIKNFLISNDLSELKMPLFILQVWKNFGNEKEVKEYMETISESNFIMLIKVLIKNKGLDEISISEAIDFLKEFMDIKTLENKLDNIISSKQFEKENLELVESFNSILKT
jgi:predicted KAP-like P-loop ATPase